MHMSNNKGYYIGAPPLGGLTPAFRLCAGTWDWFLYIHAHITHRRDLLYLKWYVLWLSILWHNILSWLRLHHGYGIIPLSLWIFSLDYVLSVRYGNGGQFRWNIFSYTFWLLKYERPLPHYWLPEQLVTYSNCSGAPRCPAIICT